MMGRWLIVIMLLAVAGCGRPEQPAPAPAAAPAPAPEAGRNPQSRNFRVPNFNDEGIMESQVFGDEALMLRNDNVQITGLRIEFYKYAGEERLIDMTVTSPSCVFDRGKNNVRSDEEIRIARDDFVVTGRGYSFNNADKRMEIYSEAKVVLKGAQKAFQPGEEKQGNE